jgi:mannose-6-phosphate isomerase-like protein (cupin superfamily)
MIQRLLQIAASAGVLLSAPAWPQSSRPQPLVIPLKASGGYQELLNGSPQTAGVRSGFVRLKPGETVGWHTTGAHEETLVILHGQGAALIEGRPQCDFVAPAVTYIPPETRHNVRNTGAEPLEYVYVVAPVKP